MTNMTAAEAEAGYGVIRDGLRETQQMLDRQIAAGLIHQISRMGPLKPAARRASKDALYKTVGKALLMTPSEVRLLVCQFLGDDAERAI